MDSAIDELFNIEAENMKKLVAQVSKENWKQYLFNFFIAWNRELSTERKKESPRSASSRAVGRY